MPTKGDREFVRIAMAKGMLKPEDARAALVKLTLAEENKAMMSVDRVLVMEELLTREQVREIQAEQHRQLIFCACGQKNNVFEFAPGTKCKCKSCGRVIEVPGDATAKG